MCDWLPTSLMGVHSQALRHRDDRFWTEAAVHKPADAYALLGQVPCFVVTHATAYSFPDSTPRPSGRLQCALAIGSRVQVMD